MNERYEQLKLMAKKAWFVFHNERDYAHENAMLLDQLERFATLVEAAAVAREREACAKLCDDLLLTGLGIRDWADGTYDCAKAIRARGEK